MSCSCEVRCVLFHCRNLCSNSSAAPVVWILFFSVQSSREVSTMVRLRRANIWKEAETVAGWGNFAPYSFGVGPFPSLCSTSPTQLNALTLFT